MFELDGVNKCYKMRFNMIYVYCLWQALTIHFQSYMNKVKMVLAVDEEAIPDPQKLCDDLANALNLIKDAV